MSESPYEPTHSIDADTRYRKLVADALGSQMTGESEAVVDSLLAIADRLDEQVKLQRAGLLLGAAITDVDASTYSQFVLAVARGSWVGAPMSDVQIAAMRSDNERVNAEADARG